MLATTSYQQHRDTRNEGIEVATISQGILPLSKIARLMFPGTFLTMLVTSVAFDNILTTWLQLIQRDDGVTMRYNGETRRMPN